MKTWAQLARVAKAQGFKLVHGTHSASLIAKVDRSVVGTIEWWIDDRKTRDRILRAMIEAAMGSK